MVYLCLCWQCPLCAALALFWCYLTELKRLCFVSSLTALIACAFWLSCLGKWESAIRCSRAECRGCIVVGTGWKGLGVLWCVRLTREPWVRGDSGEMGFIHSRSSSAICTGVFPASKKGLSGGCVRNLSWRVRTALCSAQCCPHSCVSVHLHTRNYRPPSHLHAMAHVPFWEKGVREGRGNFYWEKWSFFWGRCCWGLVKNGCLFSCHFHNCEVQDITVFGI